jgi:Fis family transcriptional regulator
MSKLDEPIVIGTFTASSASTSSAVADSDDRYSSREGTLRSEVERSMRRFFEQIEDEPVTDLHRMVMAEVEAPLLEAVMRHTGNNQSKASIILGLNRGTLRTKLKLYGLL